MRVVKQLIDHLGMRGYLTVDQVDKLRRMGLAEAKPDPASGQFDIRSAYIDDLDLTVRAYNVLLREGVRSVSELVALSEVDIRKLRNMSDQGSGRHQAQIGPRRTVTAGVPGPDLGSG
jgi:DNA-directed RNA polymerase alpha subunit